jgi:hypothetical protein
VKRLAVLLSLLSALPSVSTAAGPGAVLRVVPRDPNASPLTGHLIERTIDRMVLETDHGPRMLTAAEVLVAEQRHRGPGRSSIGGAVGFGLGMLATYLVLGEEAGGSDMFPGLGAAVVVSGGVGGAALGAIVGSQVHEERWQPIEGWDYRPAGGVTPHAIPALRPGTPIRVTGSTAGKATTVATVVRTEPDAVHARLENGRAVTFPATEVLLVEQRRTLRERSGSMLGGLVGIAAGIAHAKTTEERPITEAVQVFAATGAGAIIGGMLGRASSRRWEVVGGWDHRAAVASPRIGLQFAWRW